MIQFLVIISSYLLLVILGTLTPLVHGVATLNSTIPTGSTVSPGQVPPTGRVGNWFAIGLDLGEGLQLLGDNSWLQFGILFTSTMDNVHQDYKD